MFLLSQLSSCCNNFLINYQLIGNVVDLTEEVRIGSRDQEYWQQSNFPVSEEVSQVHKSNCVESTHADIISGISLPKN